MYKSAFVIAAPTSGQGKTTVSRGLMALFSRRGYHVQPFKCGPDYIDTKFHEAVCGRPSINLDTFMASPDHVRELFARYSGVVALDDVVAHASQRGNADTIPDVCIVEGMMGLFDGYDRARGSSYEIASILGLPIVLVVDARSAAYSMAALLSGFLHFRPVVGHASQRGNHETASQLPCSEAWATTAPRNQIVGVIYNKVGSARHEALLRQVCDDLGVPCLGCIPKSADLEQSSRYLGLDFSQELDTEALVNLLAEHLDIEKLLLLTSADRHSDENHGQPASVDGLSDKNLALPASVDDLSDEEHGLPTSVLVARNAESFSFIYAETLDRLGDVRFFDPETDVPDFEGVDLLYLPGGYPEKHLDALTANATCRESIRAYAECGGRIVAECGGMMYLCRSIVTDDGEYPMCGVLPHVITARKNDRHLSLGYRRFVLDGREYRGHEFHYTQFFTPPLAPPLRGEGKEEAQQLPSLQGTEDSAQQLPSLQGEGLGVGSVTQVYDAFGRPVPTPVFRYKNVLASYTHLYELPLNF